MMDCKRALEESQGDMDAAVELLRKKGIAKADKRSGRVAGQGLVVSYIHHNGQVGVLVELNCETDFVARTDDFKALAQDVALHIASADPIGVNPEDIPQDLVASEKRIAEEQAAEQGKPENIREKIVEGKLKKFIAERTLTEQLFRAIVGPCSSCRARPLPVNRESAWTTRSSMNSPSRSRKCTPWACTSAWS